jgi:AraC family transcriptional regulator, regulatory protein of adaptative response / methylated-DNA-[protein]-cysteine methyltransferase
MNASTKFSKNRVLYLASPSEIWHLKRLNMESVNEINYRRIAEAIEYIQANFNKQPSLEEMAGQVALSPFHFQRLFSEWAGTTPKKFLQYISIEHAKNILRNSDATLFDTAETIGLSGTGRLHDLFINIEGMTPAEYKNEGRNLVINYSFTETPFGNICIASTAKGICHLAFCEDEASGLATLKQNFPRATWHHARDQHQSVALLLFHNKGSQLPQLKLHLKGTAFQLKVWQALLTIPMGHLATYGAIAKKIGAPNSSRAVGTAIGNNPVAFLIPCHRVIQSTGIFGNYMWGSTRKKAIIGWEQAQIQEPAYASK